MFWENIWCSAQRLHTKAVTLQNQACNVRFLTINMRNLRYWTRVTLNQKDTLLCITQTATQKMEDYFDISDFTPYKFMTREVFA